MSLNILRRRLPSPKSSTVVESSRSSEKVNEEVSSVDPVDCENSCDESDYVYDSEGEDDDTVWIEEDLIGRKVLVCRRKDDESTWNCLDEDRFLTEEEDRDENEEDDGTITSNEDMEDNGELSRTPRYFNVGKKYFGMKQPRSFDLSETVSNSDESSVGFSVVSSSSLSSSECARGLGLALDDGTTSSQDSDYTEMDDAENYSFKSVESDGMISSLRDEIESEDESDSQSEAYESDDESATSEDTSRLIEDVSTESRVRTDSIALEDLEEIINESSTSESEIEFSDTEEVSFDGPLSREHRSDSTSTLSETLTNEIVVVPQNKVKRVLSNGRLFMTSSNDLSSTKRLRCVSHSSVDDCNLSNEQMSRDPDVLPSLPWLSLGPSLLDTLEAEKHTRTRPLNAFPNLKTVQYENEGHEHQYESELNESSVPLLTPPQYSSDEEVCEWPSNLADDTALTEAALSLRPLSPQSLDDDVSIKVVSFDPTSRSKAPSPAYSDYEQHSGLTPKLNGISMCFQCIVKS